MQHLTPSLWADTYAQSCFSFALTIGDMEPCPASTWFPKVFITEAMEDASWRNDAGTWV